MRTHACTILYACLLLENCCGLFHTVSEGKWGLKLHCNSSFEEEWIPLPEANFEEMKSCFAKQVVVYMEAYHAFHRTAYSHNLNWTSKIFLVFFKALTLRIKCVLLKSDLYTTHGCTTKALQVICLQLNCQKPNEKYKRT